MSEAKKCCNPALKLGLPFYTNLPSVMRKSNLRSALTIPLILRWARAHRRRTGSWPRITSGPVLDASGENWRALDMALRYGNRGLPAGQSLPQLLRRQRAG